MISYGYAGTKGFLDDLPVEKVKTFEENFLRYMKEQKTDLVEMIREEKKMTDEIDAGLKVAVEAFKASFS